MSIVIISDLHRKTKEPYRTATRKFLEWVVGNFKDDIIIQTGDLFDSSSIPHDLIDETLYYLLQLKEIYIITGNHDYSSRNKNILLPFKHHKNIHVFERESKITLDGYKILLLPYQNNMTHYPDIKGKYDIVISHLTFPGDAYSDEGVDLSNIDSPLFIYGHGHKHNRYMNKRRQNHIIQGVNIITRNGEQSNHVLRIDD